MEAAGGGGRTRRCWGLGRGVPRQVSSYFRRWSPSARRLPNRRSARSFCRPFRALPATRPPSPAVPARGPPGHLDAEIQARSPSAVMSPRAFRVCCCGGHGAGTGGERARGAVAMDHLNSSCCIHVLPDKPKRERRSDAL